MTDGTTHWDGCHAFGRKHYDCLLNHCVKVLNERDALAAELAEAYRMSDGKGRLFQQAVAEGERFRAALEHIRRIAPLGEPTYPECYRRIQVIAYEALRGTERTADDLPPDTATVTCRHGVELVRRTRCPDCEAEPLTGGVPLKEFLASHTDQPAVSPFGIVGDAEASIQRQLRAAKPLDDLDTWAESKLLEIASVHPCPHRKSGCEGPKGTIGRRCDSCIDRSTHQT